jgi:membrane protease YdiL (CAAX protease family)
MLFRTDGMMVLKGNTKLLGLACAVSMLYPLAGTKKAFESLYAILADYAPSDFASSLYQFYFTFVFFFLLPFSLVPKEERAGLGLSLSHKKVGIVSAIAFVALCTPLIWLGSKDPQMLSEYPLSKGYFQNPSMALPYVFSLFLYYVGWEALFRGILLFSLVAPLGQASAIMIQTCISCMLHIGKPTPEYLASIPFGVLMGILAIRTRSFFYPVLCHFSIGLLNDIFCAFRLGLF